MINRGGKDSHDRSGLSRRIDRTGLILTVQRQRSRFVIIFLLVWLTGWLIGGGFAAQATLNDWQSGNPDRWFMTFWMAAWAFGTVKAVQQLLWLSFGREQLRITNQTLYFQRWVPLLSLLQRARRYESKAVTALEWRKAQPNRPDNMYFSGAPTGGLQLVTEEDSQTLFTSLTQEEANRVIADIVRNSHVRLGGEKSRYS